MSLLFLEADEHVLLRRFSETRRPHPLAVNQPAVEGIREEREALGPIRKTADHILDTSSTPCTRFATTCASTSRCGRRRAQARGLGDFLRLQVRAALRGRPRLRRALPAQPELRPRAQEAHRQRRARSCATCAARRTRGPSSAAPRASWPSCSRATSRKARATSRSRIGCTGGRHRSVMIANALAGRTRGPGSDRPRPPSRPEAGEAHDRHRRRDPRPAGRGARERSAAHRRRHPAHRRGVHRLGRRRVGGA